MEERYEPKADFLKEVLNEAVSFTGAEAADSLRKLIDFTQDDDAVNRDWAALLLSQQDVDTPEVRTALLKVAADDVCAPVRAEAIAGLAQRAPALALPLVRRELALGEVTAPVFEAAEILADRSLADDLQPYVTPSGDSYLDGVALDAFMACGGVL